MKRLVNLLILTFLVFAACYLGAQDSLAVVDTPPVVDTSVVIPPPGQINPGTYLNFDAFLQGINWVYGFIIIIVGYLSAYIPVLSTISKTTYRILALAIVVGAAFFFGAGSSLPSLVLTYLISTKSYELLFKLIKRTPTVAEAKIHMASWRKEA